MSGESRLTGFNCEVLILVEVTFQIVLILLLLLDVLQDRKHSEYCIVQTFTSGRFLTFGLRQTFCCLWFYSVRCGSGLSGDYLSEEGHYWVGVDISTAMLGWFNNKTLIKALIL